MNALLDTNILIDYLNGVEAAREEIQRYSDAVISPITWMEVMVGVLPEEEPAVRLFLSAFPQLPIDSAVAERAVAIRRKVKIRLPDAIIWASAQCANALLVTRNSKDFPSGAPEIRVPYSL